MKRLSSSLAGRLVVWFILVQSGVSVVALAATLFLWRQAGDEYAFAQMHLEQVVVAAIQPGRHGELIVADTPALAAFKAARPGVSIAVVKGRQVLAGSSPVLANALRRHGAPAFINATFAFSQGPLAGVTATATAIPSRWGDVMVVGAGNRLQLADIPALALYMGGYLVRVMVLVVLGSVVVTPFVISRALRPLQAAGREAARIDLRRRDLRLPTGEGVPSELRGLIAAINAALDRLDAGVRRQQRIAAEAAHELRTPLAVLAARIDSQPPSEGQSAMRRDLERMRTLVDQLLLAARLETYDAPLDEAFDLVALARDVVADCTPLALAHGRDLALIPEVERRMARGGRRVIEGALANLISNAVRVEPLGGTVEVRVLDAGELWVVDHGPGVPLADREQVFDPFWRRDDDHPGAGLGLAIVKQAAVLHGGEVLIEDTPGGGATFRMRFGG
jgi:signal transduction histidine kinase